MAYETLSDFLLGKGVNFFNLSEQLRLGDGSFLVHTFGPQMSQEWWLWSTMHWKMRAYQPMRQAPIRKPPWVKINIEILDFR